MLCLLLMIINISIYRSFIIKIATSNIHDIFRICAIWICKCNGELL